jgi:uncharacterized protein
MEMNVMLPDLISRLGQFVDDLEKRKAEKVDPPRKKSQLFKPIQQAWWVPLVFCVALLAVPHSKPTLPKSQSLPATLQITVGGKKIYLEHALTIDQRNIGLMGRADLRDDQGMLFLLTDIPRPYKISMKNIAFPVDFVFVDGINVVKVITLQPCSRDCLIIKVEDKSSFLVELKAGTAKKLGIEAGSRIELSKNKNL